MPGDGPVGRQAPGDVCDGSRQRATVLPVNEPENMSKPVLVTGGAGYIGSVAVARLLEEGRQVRVLDNLSAGHRDAVADGAEFVEADLREPAGLTEVLDGIGTVFHFAAKSLVEESERHPDRYWENNLLGTRNLLNAMEQTGVERLVLSSTAAVYGDPGVEVIDEETPARPINCYGATKLAAELLIETRARTGGIAAAALRYFNVAGAYGRYGERHNEETHLIPRLLDGAGITIYGADWPTHDGTCVRDYIHVLDLVEAHLLAERCIKSGEFLRVNLGTGRGYSVREVIAALNRVTGADLDPAVAPRRAGDPARLVTSNHRAGMLLGWSPIRDIETIVKDAWEFHRRTEN